MSRLASLSGSNVFLTGATGLIGGEMLRRLAGMGPEGPQGIFCLTRSDTAEQARKRLLERLGMNGGGNPRHLSFTPVVGDVSRPGLGVSPTTGFDLRRRVDLIVHCAAVTSFLKRKACQEVNVAGLRNLLEFAAGCSKPVRLVYFGSAAACGNRSDTLLREEDYPRRGDRHFVHYTKTKAVAERILTRQQAVSDCLVLRPSIVLPDNLTDSRLAREILWALVLMKEIAYLPVSGEVSVDAVPLSFVGECAIRLIAKTDRRHRCYHISAGAKSATWREVTLMMKDVFGKEIRCCGRESQLARRLPRGREKTLVRALSMYLPFINQNVVFCNRRLYLELGDPLPRFRRFQAYLPELLRRISFEDALLQSRDP